MTTVNRDALRAFLAEHAKDLARIPAAMDLLEPLFVRAEAGTYTLAHADEIDQESVRTVIATIIDRTVTEAVFVSKERLFLKPNGMVEEAYQDSLRSIFGESLVYSFSARFWPRLSSTLSNRLGSRLASALSPAIRTSFGAHVDANLMGGFGVSLRTDLGDHVCATFGDTLEISIFGFLGFTICGDIENIERFTPLIRFLPKAIPIGEKKHKSGVWIVLVA